MVLIASNVAFKQHYRQVLNPAYTTYHDSTSIAKIELILQKNIMDVFENELKRLAKFLMTDVDSNDEFQLKSWTSFIVPGLATDPAKNFKRTSIYLTL